MKNAAAIALCCAGGGLARYYLSGWLYAYFGRAFPIGTLIVNFIGAYCIGVVMELASRSALVPDVLRLGLTVGFLGGLTTFSTFSYEAFTLLEEGRIAVACAYIAASVVVCLLFTWLGVVTVRSLV